MKISELIKIEKTKTGQIKTKNINKSNKNLVSINEATKNIITNKIE